MHADEHTKVFINKIEKTRLGVYSSPNWPLFIGGQNSKS